MESVFSEAYVVLAASWAEGQNDGFLWWKSRTTTTSAGNSRSLRDREVVTVVSGPSKQKAGAAVYVCEMIDKFEEDVLKGYLNTRAWVLQERALARRTVYFTGRQTYWECGRRVRCETGTLMTNKLASFLGDPSFPSVALSGNRGEEIRWYQELYAQYSRLSLSRSEDRPIAIRGLESRLISKFANKYRHADFTGRYGVLNDGPTSGLLHRSLLWRRAAGSVAATATTPRGLSRGGGLEKFPFPPGYDGVPPSWSWMSYSGGIDYIQIKGDTVEWQPLDIYPHHVASPSRSASSSPNRGTARASPTPPVMLGPPRDRRSHSKTIVAQAWNFCTDMVPRKRGPPDMAEGDDASGAGNTPSSQLIYDTSCMSMTAGHMIKCIVVGMEKEMADAKRHSHRDRMCFILIVRPVMSAGVDTVRCFTDGELKDLKRYERIGAGSMVGRCILALEGGGESIAVC